MSISETNKTLSNRAQNELLKEQLKSAMQANKEAAKKYAIERRQRMGITQTNVRTHKPAQELINQRRIEHAHSTKDKKADNINELETFLQNRKIEALIHFTRIENLSSILSMGIWPESSLQEKHLRHINNDKMRWDHRPNCTCLTVEYPNHFLLEHYMRNSPESRWVIICLNPKLLSKQTNYYAQHNAATGGIANQLYRKTKLDDFKYMFNDIISYTKSNGENITIARDTTLLPELPTSDQAEILVNGIIDIQFITDIIFYNENDAKNYYSKLNSLHINPIINPYYFDLPRDIYVKEHN